MNKDFLFNSNADRKLRLRNFPAAFTPADAPPAASNRALRRLWTAEANRILRRTGDADAAQRAGEAGERP
jgi:hypothetical protein